MPVTRQGIVYYADDPDKKVFRIVTPSVDDAELDVPDRVYGKWTVFGVDPSRAAVMEFVPFGTAELTGNVGDPPTTNGLTADGKPWPLPPPEPEPEPEPEKTG